MKGGYDVYIYPDHTCGCGCYYANSGGSSSRDNGSKNDEEGLWSLKK